MSPIRTSLFGSKWYCGALNQVPTSYDSRPQQVSTAKVSSIRTPLNSPSTTDPLISADTVELTLEPAGVGVFEYELQSREQRFSPLCLKLWGLKEGETPSPERLEGLMHLEDRHLAQHAVDSLSPSGPGEFAIVHRIIRPDGALRWIETHGRTVFADNGQDRYAVKSVGTMVDVTDRVIRLQRSAPHFSAGALGVLGTFIDLWVASINDISARKRAQIALAEREEQLRLATEAAEVGLWDVDLLTDTLFWPPRVKAMFGISPEVPVSMADFYAGLHPADRERTTNAFAAALDPEHRALYDVEYRTVGKEDGAIRWVAAKGRGIFDSTGRCVRVIGTAIDITERKHVQTALEEANKQKDEFLAMLAHELRNPLAPIGTASELLLRTLGDDNRSRAAIGIIKRQFTQLTRLVDDLLDVSRVTLGRISLQMCPVDLADVVAQAVETVEPQLRDKGHGLSIMAANYETLYVNGDFARLVQCVGNLLTNAIKYTDVGGQVSICTRANEQNVFIEVSDTGIGMSAELLPRVFDMFVQSDRALDRSQGGLGIGLAVVKRLIQMHGGTVSARSEGLGRGSQFEIRLPRLQLPATVKVDETTLGSIPRRVLIVDDNVDAADSLSMLLAAQGHETEVAYRPDEALVRAAAFRPDVALLDIGLPEMDGYQLAPRLRAIPELSGLRIFAVSGYGLPEDRQRSKAAGFDGHLVKPIDLAALQRALGASS